MNAISNILSAALRQPLEAEELPVITEDRQELGGDMQLSLHRYALPGDWQVEDTALLVYHPVKKDTASTAVELKYCIAGNRYCSFSGCKGPLCAEHSAKDCLLSQATADVITVNVSTAFFQNLDYLQDNTLPIPAAGHSPMVKVMPVNARVKVILQQILHHSHEGLWEKVHLQSKSLELLLMAAENMAEKQEETFVCRFLANPEDREKIQQAKEIILQHLEDPLTIKELSRKIAMNECYLKKGFKEMFGTTIYDYFQKERMGRAKFLLYEKGLSVSEVAVMMGYSCISHFSTAFKKHTGLKPCELLLR
jgi:AraC-like DNA-binding protein